ncbi:plasmid mobilization protein [Granulicella arctica]|uniref:Uncharacterized protein n=1 Tax=Granulicella arctica TaxID=940613 RepID=A0A7Y9PH65_9BACT|nr:hypothetical protein [Granulicella arctica]NYF79820.1 hypothetical protein [Granulicella arctica]
MASPDSKLQEIAEPASASPAASDVSRVKSIATRLTEAELGEIEAAAFKAGKKVSEWLRDTALASVRAPQQEQTDTVLLAEIIGMRDLMLNLFAQASKGPLSTKDMRKMSAYADSIKEQKAREFLSRKRSQTTTK